jgi:protein gp37
MAAGNMNEPGAQLFTTEPAPEASTGTGGRTVDVLILTAVQDELEAVLALGENGRAGWRELRDRDDLRYHRRAFPSARGGRLEIAAAWTGDMGERTTALRGVPLLAELDPACLAMCGICAGYRAKTALGDVIIADRVFGFDEGKRIAGEDGIAFRHDLRTFGPEAVWKMDAAYLARELDLAALARERPPSKDAQRWWLLHTLHAHEVEGGSAPVSHPDRARACPGWTAHVKDALEGGLVAMKTGALQLTGAGRDKVLEARLLYPDGLPPVPPLRVHVAPVATVGLQAPLHYCTTVQVMSDGSAIEWTDATWNPVRGCVKVSPGCKHCYAETFAERFRGVPGHPYEQGFDLLLVPDKLLDPLRWTRSRRIFVNSMSDLFQDGVPDDFVRQVFEVMAAADWHIYQMLTKRAARMRALTLEMPPEIVRLSHIWLGVSVEDRRYGLPRIDELRSTPAEVRFLSIEPLLEDLGEVDLRGIDWVIVGGESGPGARPMDEAWVLSIRDQCRAARVPFFFKQWGGVQKSRKGRDLEGRSYDEYPTVVPAAPPSPATRAHRVAALTERLSATAIAAE